MSGEPDYQPTYQPQYAQQQPQYVQQQPQYVQQQPQYVQQQPVYVQQQPQQMYVQQPVYVQQQQPQQMYVQQPVYVQQQQQTQQQPVYVQQTTTTTTTTQGGEMTYQTTTIAGEPGEFGCGTSSYGIRMDFKNRKYKDVFFLGFWIVAMFIWFILLIVFASKDDSDSTSSSARRLAEETGPKDDFVGKIIGSFVIICVVAILCGFLWLNLMFRWAKNILKFLIGLKLLFWFLLSIICLIVGAALGENGGGFIAIGVIYLIVFLFFCLYYWCVRRRLRLAAAMIRLGTMVVQKNQATITLQFATSLGLFAWWILWISVYSLYLAKYEYNGFVAFLMVIMGYWTLEVLCNVAHVTTCGVTAVWWFNKEGMVNPTWQSYRYATSKGLGSICLGSFLVAIIRTLRSMAKQGASRGGIAACICYILLSILDWLAHYFSVYAYVQVAIYGVDFWQAAKNTWDLLSSRGFDAIINDDLSNMVLAAGAFVGAVITFLLGGFITLGMFSNYEDSEAIGYAVVMAIVGFYIGYYFTLEFMYAVYSAIKAIFVCWAEDPAALKVTHPKCYELMATAWAKVYGGGNDYDSLKTDQDLD